MMENPESSGLGLVLHHAGKRIIDICGAGAALVLLGPLLLLIADRIRRDSEGPALFRQDREGFLGKPFAILKFRTMAMPPTGETDVFEQARRADPRVTRVGAFLRQSSLDELPQLLNVLDGSMSLVGPRPHVSALSARFAPQIPGYYERLGAKPGITGLAQISGCRGETATVAQMAARISLDRAYVAQPSLRQDLLICLHTLNHSIGGDDAY
jgi:putative colanic acid biosynthesis UDP-glucose lipid carrier transferase